MSRGIGTTECSALFLTLEVSSGDPKDCRRAVGVSATLAKPGGR